MANAGDIHEHECNRCGNLYECECTAGSAPESYLCPHCSSFETDAEFLHAIGIRWDEPLPSIAALESQGLLLKETGAKLLMKPGTDQES